MSLQLINIKKSYGKNKILDGIDIDLTNGIYGFLGANGVGKTTLFKILSGFITDYKGKVVMPDAKNGEVVLGFLPQNFTGYPDMTIQQFLTYLGSIKANINKEKVIRDIDEKLELFNLCNIRGKKLKELSGGQLRRVGLAQAFQLNPKVVMLDEPTTGLDPTERIKFRNYISGAGQEQIILISTHIVSDLESISKEIFILKDRHFAMQGTEENLIKKCFGYVWEMMFDNELDIYNQIKNQNVSMIYDYGNKKIARIISTTPPFDEAVQVKPTLNDVYLVNFKKEENSSVK